jgi:hypothetical protein
LNEKSLGKRHGLQHCKIINAQNAFDKELANKVRLILVLATIYGHFTISIEQDKYNW